MPLNRDARLARVIVQSNRLTEDVFVIDVGCSGGLDPALRQLEPALAGIGIDPLLAEIDRLTIAETNPKMSYLAAFAASDREYLARPQHSGNWYARSMSTAVLEPKRDVIGEIL